MREVIISSMIEYLQTFLPLILLSCPLALLAIVYYRHILVAPVNEATFRTIAHAFAFALALHPLVHKYMPLIR